jgi:ribosomal protein S12 methylthiotransferase accessory factor
MDESGWDRTRTTDGGVAPSPVERFRDALTPPPVHAFSIADADRLDVPVWTTAQWRSDGTVASSSGYGPTDDRARVGAWGELAERAVHDVLPTLDRRRGSYPDVRATTSALDPRRLRLPVGTDYRVDDDLTWVETTRYPSGDPLWVPVEAAATSPTDLGHDRDPAADDLLYTPITNGMGAGESFERAFAHGLLELVQRDGNSVAYRATDRGIVIDVDVDNLSDPAVREAAARFDARGVDVQVKLADTVFGIPSVYVVGSERDPADAPGPLALTACGEAAHPDREVALRKALLEFAASRARKLFYHGPLDAADYAPAAYRARVRESPPPRGEPHAFEAMCEWATLDARTLADRIADPVFRVADRRSFDDLPTADLAHPAALLDEVVDRFRDAGMDPAYVDFSPHPDVRVVKAIVPGMEVETMSYGRIGPRNVRRLCDPDWDAAGTDGLVGRGPPPDGAEAIPLAPDDEAALGGPAWFDPAAAREAVSGLYPLYREPPRHTLAIHDDA